MRQLFLDTGPGEARGVVTLDGWPERLLIEREGVDRGPRLGARYLARIREVSPALRMAYLDLGEGEAVLLLGRAPAPDRGAAVEVEITAEARSGKAAVARFLGPGAGTPRRLQDPPSLEARLSAVAPGAEIVRGEDALQAADEAEAAALAAEHAVGEGLVITIQPTRALAAVDLDWTGQGAGRARLKANLRGLGHAARLLRLKALGGTAVIDLIGFPGEEAPAILAEARRLFEPDQPGVTVLPASRLGLLQVARPHREQPLHEQLCAADGRLSARSVAQRLVRALEREGRFDPGARLVGRCAPETAAEAAPLAARLGPRFAIAAELGWDRLKTDIRVP